MPDQAEYLRRVAAMAEIVRADAPSLPFEVARALQLPPAAPAFIATASMESTFFLTPPVREFVGRLGHALRSEAWT